MRVLVLSQHYWPESFRINDVVAALRRAGCEVEVLTGQPNYPDGKVFAGHRAHGLGVDTGPAGERIHRVPLVPRGRGGALRLVGNYLSFLASASVLGPWLLRGRGYDVVFVYGTSPILQAIAGVVLARIKRAALVTWVQDLWPQSLEVTGYVRNPRALAAVAAVVRWIYRRNDLLLAQSRAFVSAVRPMAGSTPVAYLPNPGEAGAPTQVANHAAPQLPPGFNIVFAGNLGTVQSLETVLDAAERLRAEPDIRFTLVGSGSRSAWLAEQVARRDLRNVALPGRFAPQAMPALFAQASALLVTLNRSEVLGQTVPSKVQSYLAAGRPVLAALDGEGAQVVRDAGAGIASPAEDAPALAAAVLSLGAASPQELERMGQSARRYYEAHFEPDRVALALQEQLRSAIAARHGLPAPTA